MNFKKELIISILSCIKASSSILEIYNQDFEVFIKEDDSPLTKADLKSNEIIISNLQKNFPEHAILSEEIADNGDRFNKKYTFVIDPIDGTKSFVAKTGEFCICIALLKEGTPVMGVVHSPTTGVCYFAIKDEGAFKVNFNENRALEDRISGTIECNGFDEAAEILLNNSQRIKVSGRKKDLRMLIGRTMQSEKTLKLIKYHSHDIKDITPLGSALKGCMISEGVYDVYYNFGRTMKWDTCAMEVIVFESGGMLLKHDGERIDYAEKKLENEGFYILNMESNKW